ncbi:MAG: NUDIX hydrolase [Armatimonadota bacterium]|nr:NUDIX hydrolase [Armatimonadota bacterium]
MELREETIESKEVFSGRLVKLRVDRVRLPNGRESTREVVVHRGAVAAVPLIDSDRVVMVRQFRQAAGETLLEIPAGTLDPGEDPAECVIRELEEEIGRRPNRVTLMFRSYLAPGYSSEMLHTFLAEDLVPIESSSDEDEFIEIVEVRLDEAVDKILSGEIKDAKSICGILMAQRFLATRDSERMRS